ncbi:MAG: GntR family transcriptional regulator [Alphaproteobacteria bacterium]|nr:GntR family transcriptional regulator [Alphaproteobacteria bacterium]
MRNDAKTRKKKLYDALRRDILTMDRVPGADIDEVTLAEAFGLSRTPLREVLQQLAGEGYISNRENRGSRVADLSHQTLRDFFLTAPMIYAAVARLAALNANALQIDELKRTQSEFKSALKGGSAQDRTLANTRFHEIIGEMAHSIYLMPSLQRLLIDHSRIGMTFNRPRNDKMAANLAMASQQHDQLIDCIEAGDEDAAAALAVDHWNLSRDQIEMFVMPQSLDTHMGAAITANSA